LHTYGLLKGAFVIQVWLILFVLDNVPYPSQIGYNQAKTKKGSHEATGSPAIPAIKKYSIK
jgi:hypothetical protein